MKLSDLLAHKKNIEQYLINDIDVIVKQNAGHSLYVVKENEIQFPNHTQRLEQQYQQIKQSFADYQDTLNNLLNELQTHIDELTPTYLNNSHRLYSNEFAYESIDITIARELELPEESMTYVETRIKQHGDWRYPGMIIRPGKEKWIEHLVGCDPLYLVDIDFELFAIAMNRFNPTYQARLRTYTVKESARKPMLTSIPDSQFSFCLVYNFFNYKPIEIIKGYLTELFNKLKPGGTVAFTFNNCDEPGAVELVEKNFVCYTPGSLIMQLCQNIGYETTNVRQLDTACSWVEISKPGTLSSLRGGQNLARLKVRQKT